MAIYVADIALKTKCKVHLGCDFDNKKKMDITFSVCLAFQIFFYKFFISVFTLAFLDVFWQDVPLFAAKDDKLVLSYAKG